MGRGKSSILLVHDDGDRLDALTRLFESRGFDVAIAATALSALSLLESRGGEQAFAVVVAAWDPDGRVGAKLYRRAVKRRQALRDRFVFVGEERSEEYDQLVGERCPLLSPDGREELIRVVESIVARIRRVSQSRMTIEEIEWMEAAAPALLLVDDEPLQLRFMVEMFRDLGFQVTPAESGNAATELLQQEEFDVILCDWYMPDGSGADVFRWMRDRRPELVPRLLFLSGHTDTSHEEEAPGCRVLPKGQDSQALIRAVLDVARASRGG